MMVDILVFDRHDHVMEPYNPPVAKTEPQSSAAAAAESDSEPEDEPWQWLNHELPRDDTWSQKVTTFRDLMKQSRERREKLKIDIIA